MLFCGQLTCIAVTDPCFQVISMYQLVKLTILHDLPPKKTKKYRKDNKFLTLPHPGKVQQYLVCST